MGRIENGKQKQKTLGFKLFLESRFNGFQGVHQASITFFKILNNIKAQIQKLIRNLLQNLKKKYGILNKKNILNNEH